MKLYTWDTPNGKKPAILLAELGLDYELVPIDISQGQQHEDAFLDLNPNAKIPALVTEDGVRLFESGAILTYLADREGRFLARTGQARASALAWSFWQVGGLGPMVGQWGHFAGADADYGAERFLTEVLRLLDVQERALGNSHWLAGDEYSIADMMSWPWTNGALTYLARLAPDRVPELPHTRAWNERVAIRPAVVAGLSRLRSAVQVAKAND